MIRFVGRDLARIANMDENRQPITAIKGTVDLFSCHDCKVSCSSQLTLDQHLLGRRHLRKVALRKAAQPQEGKQQLLPVFNCSLCDVTAPSQEVINISLSGLYIFIYTSGA